MDKALTASLIILLSVPLCSYGKTSSLYAGFGYSIADFKSEVFNEMPFLPGQRLKDQTNSLDIYAGYHLNKYLSFEIGYAEFGEVKEQYIIDPEIAFIVSPNDIEKIDFNRIVIDAIIEYPIIENVSLFGLLGYSYFNIDQELTGGFNPSSPVTDITNSYSEGGIFFGLGGKYLFREKYSARLQWTKSNTNDFEINAITISAEMTF